MTEAENPDLEARLRAEVERSVAPYVGAVPPFMLAKLRELSERYWREHPQASLILRRAAQGERARSGTEATGEPEREGAAAGTEKE